MKRIVVKIGSNVLTRADGTLDVTRVSALVDQVVELRRRDWSVVIVSSGAVACGRTELRLDEDLDSVEQRQLYSAVGQVRLMDLYYRLFRDYGLQVGQVLTTKRNFETARERENQRACMEVMLQHGVVPIVNENDTVSVTELMFTDNDELSGLIAGMVGAETLVLLSNIPGLYDRHPDEPGAQPLGLHPREEKLPRAWRNVVQIQHRPAGGRGRHPRADCRRQARADPAGPAGAPREDSIYRIPTLIRNEHF